MNYKKLYDTLYANGYHDDGTNIGKGLVNLITQSYKFDTILDIGCSQGYAVQKYQESNIKAHGIDISDVAIKKAHELGNTTCQQGSVLDIPHDDNSFEAVVSSDVLEHLEKKDIPKAIIIQKVKHPRITSSLEMPIQKMA
jgi:2-polyprenyl-3-methyl-5-hydroxy-6-metoxy-1,4-benzoquinol methylase